ncbi:nitrite reductase small subunit NirD [Gaoshiqia sp. Z1-71]|uniref:nitrite reductase small subunit NirD n=1 Tax=Gaoshiqia hydrogeniformans TaxID=3290090 RepID=UPI003BF87C43
MDVKEQNQVKEWVQTAVADEFPENGGAAVLVKGEQIAVFNFTDEGRWFATQNQCPHKGEMAISRGLTGDADGHPKVACPFHKRTFSLEDGKCLTDENYQLKTYPVKVEDGYVYIGIV